MIASITCNGTLSGTLKPRTVFHDIESALNTLILTAVGSTPVAWENVKYEPSVGTAFIQVFHVPLRTSPMSLGYGGYTDHRGVVQLNMCVPSDFGTLAAILLADKMTGTIRRGIVTTYNSVPVRISAISVGSMDIQKAWAILPVTINWQCYLPD